MHTPAVTQSFLLHTDRATDSVERLPPPAGCDAAVATKGRVRPPRPVP